MVLHPEGINTTDRKAFGGLTAGRVVSENFCIAQSLVPNPFSSGQNSPFRGRIAGEEGVEQAGSRPFRGLEGPGSQRRPPGPSLRPWTETSGPGRTLALRTESCCRHGVAGPCVLCWGVPPPLRSGCSEVFQLWDENAVSKHRCSTV